MKLVKYLKSTNIIHHINKLKKKKSIKFIDAEKVFYRIQYPFIIKQFRIIAIENFLNLTNSIY